MSIGRVLFHSLILCSFLSSCSLLRRDLEEGDGPTAVAEEEKAGDERLFPATSVDDLEFGGGSHSHGIAETRITPESEVSRLQTKVAALETRIEVLSANLEKLQLQKSQPVIEANANPEANLAAPVSDEMKETISQSQTQSAAPIRGRSFSDNKSALAAGAESEFNAAMEKFQRGLYSDAGTAFGQLAQTHAGHLLAAHSLYWAGESGARLNQWPAAVQHWENLQRLYPRSTYAADSLVGLGRAYEAMGDEAKASNYRNLALRRFPQSPVSMALKDSSLARGKSVARTLPASQELRSEEEAVPLYDGGSNTGEEQ